MFFLSNLYFTDRKDCFCKLYTSYLNTLEAISMVKIRSVTSQKVLFLSCVSIEVVVSAEKLELNGMFGWLNGFKHGEQIAIELISNVFTYAETITLSSITADEWRVIDDLSKVIEQRFLQQICLVSAGIIFPLWIDDLCVRFVVDEFIPNNDYVFVKSSTTVNVISKQPESVHKPFINKVQSIDYSNYISNLFAKSPNKSVVNSFYIVLDFVYFLLTGKSLTQKRRENTIYRHWETKFSISSDIVYFKHHLYGRCYQRQSTLSRNFSIDPVMIVLPKQKQQSLSTETLFLGSLERVSFPKNGQNLFDSKKRQYTCFIQLVIFDCQQGKNIGFYIPKDIWKEMQLEVGDKASCLLIPYSMTSLETLTINVPVSLKDVCEKWIVEKFKAALMSNNYDTDPILLRKNMIVHLPFSAKNDACMIDFKIKDSNQNSNDFCFISSFFLKQKSFPIKIEYNFDDCSYKTDGPNRDTFLWSSTSSLNKQFLDILSDTKGMYNILLYGSTGTGKTTFCKTFGQFLSFDENYQYYTNIVDCRDLLGLQFERIKEQIVNYFMECCFRAPSFLCFDHIDCLIPKAEEDVLGNHNYHVVLLANVFKYIMEDAKRMHNSRHVVIVMVSKSFATIHDDFIGSSVHVNKIFDHVIDMSSFSKMAFLSAFDSIKSVNGDSLMSVHDVDEFKKTFEEKIINSFNGNDGHMLRNHVLMNSLNNCENNVPSETLKVDKWIFEDSFYACTKTNRNKINSFKPVTNISFLDLYGLDNAKNILRETCIWPFMYQSVFDMSPIMLKKNILLYGLPGCGKSHLALCLANESKINFKMIKGSELLSKYIGSSEEEVRNVFYFAKNNQPILLFFDEFDALAPRRGHDSTGVTDRVVNQLLTEIDGISTSRKSNIFIIASSNRPDLIDPAVLRPGRIHCKIYCPPPVTVAERISTIEFLLKKSSLFPASGLDLILEYVASKRLEKDWLQFYSYADLKSLVNETEKNVVIKFNKETRHSYEVELEDFLKAVEMTRCSLNKTQIGNYLSAFRNFTVKKTAKHQQRQKTTLA